MKFLQNFHVEKKSQMFPEKKTVLKVNIVLD